MNFEKILNDTDLRVLNLALRAVLTDDQSHVLTEEEYSAAVDMSCRVEVEVNARHNATKDSVPLVGVAPGSIWAEAEIDGLPGCTWTYTEEGCTCSYAYDGPAWAPSDERVNVLAQGLDDATCRWVLRGADNNFGHPTFAALVRRRCAHLMAGGTPENFEETT